MDPIRLIKQDHRTIKRLFRTFEQTSKRSDRQKIGEEIIEELSIHAAMEEQLLYPALRARDPRLENGVLNALEEHHAAKLLLAELDAMKVDHERYAAKMHVVKDEIETHIAEEEESLLPRVEKAFDKEEQRAMAEAILAIKQVAPTHPHPAAPDVPPKNILAALFAKLSDASKDLVRTLIEGDKAEGHRRVRDRAKATAAAARRPA